MEREAQLHRGISPNVLRHGWIPRLRNMAGRFSATLCRISTCCTVRESHTRGITKDIIQAHVNICKKVSGESFTSAPKSVVSEISASSLQPSVKKRENDQLCEGRSSAVVSSTSGCLNENAFDAVNEQSTLASMSLSATSLASCSDVLKIPASPFQPSVKSLQSYQLSGIRSAVVSSTSGWLSDNAYDADDEQSTLTSMSLSATSVASCTDDEVISEISNKEELSTSKDEVNNQDNGMDEKVHVLHYSDAAEKVAVTSTTTTATQHETKEIDTSEVAKSHVIKEDMSVQAVKESVSSGIQCSPSTTEVCSQSDDSGKAITQVHVCVEPTGCQCSNPDTAELGLQVCQQMTSSETQYEADTSNVSTEAEVAVTSTAIQNTAEMLDTSIQAVKDTTATSMQTGSDTQDVGTQLEDESVSSGIQCSPSTTEICSQSDDSEKKITEMSTQVEVVVETTASQYSNPDTAELGLQVCQQMTSSETQYEADTSVSTQAGAAVTSTAIQNTAEMLDTSIQAVKDTTTRSMQAGPETQDMGTQWEDDRTDVNTQTDKDETDKPSLQISNTGIQVVIETASMSIQAEPDIQETGTQWEDDRLNVTTQTEKDEKEITTQTDELSTEDMPSHILHMVKTYVSSYGHDISGDTVDKEVLAFLEDLKERGVSARKAKEINLTGDVTTPIIAAIEEAGSHTQDSVKVDAIPEAKGHLTGSATECRETADPPDFPKETITVGNGQISSLQDIEKIKCEDLKVTEMSKEPETNHAKETVMTASSSTYAVQYSNLANEVSREDKDNVCISSITTDDEAKGNEFAESRVEIRTPDFELDAFVEASISRAIFYELMCQPGSKEQGISEPRDSHNYTPTGDKKLISQSDSNKYHTLRLPCMSQSEVKLRTYTDTCGEHICGTSDVRLVKSLSNLKNMPVQNLLRKFWKMHQEKCGLSAQSTDNSDPAIKAANTMDEMTGRSSQNDSHKHDWPQTSVDAALGETTDGLCSLGFTNTGHVSTLQSLDFVYDFWQQQTPGNVPVATACTRREDVTSPFDQHHEEACQAASEQMTEPDMSIKEELADVVKSCEILNKHSSEAENMDNICAVAGQMNNSEIQNQNYVYSEAGIMGLSSELAEAMQGCENESSEFTSTTSVVSKNSSSDFQEFPLPGSGWLKQSTSIPYFALLDHDPPDKKECAQQLRGTKSESILDSTIPNPDFQKSLNQGSGLVIHQPAPTPDREENTQQENPPDVNDIANDLMGHQQQVQESVPPHNEVFTETCQENPEMTTSVNTVQEYCSDETSVRFKKRCLSQTGEHHQDPPEALGTNPEGVKDVSFISSKDPCHLSNASPESNQNNDHQDNPSGRETEKTLEGNTSLQQAECSVLLVHETGVGKTANVQSTSMNISSELTVAVEECDMQNQHPSEGVKVGVSSEFSEELVVKDCQFQNQQPTETSIMGISGDLGEAINDCEMQNQNTSDKGNVTISGELAEAMEECENENHPSKSKSAVVGKKSSSDFQECPLPGTGWLKRSTSIPFFAFLDHDPPNMKECAHQLRGTQSESNLDSTVLKLDLKSFLAQAEGSGQLCCIQQPAPTPNTENYEDMPPDKNDFGMTLIGRLQELQKSTNSSDRLPESTRQNPPLRVTLSDTEICILVKPSENQTDKPSSTIDRDRDKDSTEAADKISVTQQQPVNPLPRIEIIEQKLPGSNVIGAQILQHKSQGNTDRNPDPQGDRNDVMHQPERLVSQPGGIQIIERKLPGSGVTAVQIPENRMSGNFVGNESVKNQYLQELQNCQQVDQHIGNRPHVSECKNIQLDSPGNSIVECENFQQELPRNEHHFAESTDKTEDSIHGTCTTHRSASPNFSKESARNELKDNQNKTSVASTHKPPRHLCSSICPCQQDLQELLSSGLKMHPDFLPDFIPEPPRNQQLQPEEQQPESSKQRVPEVQEETALNEHLPSECKSDVIMPVENSSSDSFVFVGSSISSVVDSSDSDAAPQIMYTDEYLEARNIDALEVESLPGDTESNDSWMNIFRRSSSHIGVSEAEQSSSDTSDSWLCVEAPTCSAEGERNTFGGAGAQQAQSCRKDAVEDSEKGKVCLDEKTNGKVSSRRKQF